MMEIKLCATCGRIKPSSGKCEANHPRELEDLKGCADCDSYAPVESMVRQADGREVCPKCQTRINKTRVKRSQLEFFGQLSLI